MKRWIAAAALMLAAFGAHACYEAPFFACFRGGIQAVAVSTGIHDAAVGRLLLPENDGVRVFVLPEEWWPWWTPWTVTGISLYDLATGAVSVGEKSFDFYSFSGLDAGQYEMRVSGIFPAQPYGNSQIAYYYNFGVTAAITVPPIPEPQSYALMLAGLALLGLHAVRRRGQRSSAMTLQGAPS
jgi:hypothetical protein